MKILMILPAFNEEKAIAETVRELQGYDYLVVNDCSQDRTAQVCIDNKLNFVSLANNLGIGGAMQTGYKYAHENGYDVAIQFDGDGQHVAAEIPKLLEKIAENDVVIGSRYLAKEGFQSSAMRRFGIKFFTFLIKMLTGKKITDATSGFRAVNKKVIEIFANDYPMDYPEPETICLLARNKYKISEVSVVMRERASGASSITFIKSIYYMIKVSLACLFTMGEKI
ncbi:MAG: glycosyltransferase family 2 protein [Oscillospiraceae bacterium]|nr:glycosyltransferase family 2 protein [Oscillospiraceae bacterium]